MNAPQVKMNEKALAFPPVMLCMIMYSTIKFALNRMNMQGMFNEKTTCHVVI
jgi:hypothetical protein